MTSPRADRGYQKKRNKPSVRKHAFSCVCRVPAASNGLRKSPGFFRSFATKPVVLRCSFASGPVRIHGKRTKRRVSEPGARSVFPIASIRPGAGYASGGPLFGGEKGRKAAGPAGPDPGSRRRAAKVSRLLTKLITKALPTQAQYPNPAPGS